MAEEPTEPPVAAPPAATPPAAAPPVAEPAPEPEDWETRFKYLLADFENFRKRTSREHERVRERARADLLRAVLPLYDAVERARESVQRSPETDPVRRGIELLWKEWTSLLTAEGVEPLARPGQPFRAEEHEAVAEAAVTPDHPEGTVVEVVQQGYSLPGGILRPAKVVVARRATGASAHARVPEPSEGPGADSPS